jgi:hypothetical protein
VHESSTSWTPGGRGNRDHRAIRVRAERGGEQPMCPSDLLGRRAVEGLPHPLPSVRELVQERRPHLKDCVGEPELEDRANDSRVGRLRAQVERVGFANSGGLVFVDESAEEVATASTGGP